MPQTINEAITDVSSADAVESLLSLVNASDPILDPTYGHGVFWKHTTHEVWGFDIDIERSPRGVVDFTALPFSDATFPTVVFDPPFHPFVNSAEELRFSGLGKNDRELKQLFQAGVSECWRVTAQHLIVKCQGYIHNHRPQWMPLWAIEVCGEPFEWLLATRKGKRISGRWKSQRSLWRHHADYLLFNKSGNRR